MTIFAPFGDATTIDVTQTTQAVALPTMPSGTAAFALVARQSDIGSLFIKLGSAAVSVTVASGLKIPKGELERAAIFVVPASETHIAIICDGNNGKVTLQAGAIYSGDTTTVIADNAVTNAKLRDSGALSVIGRSANSAGDPADISATAATDAVLRESGSVLGFGTIATAGIANDAVTYAKIQNVSAASRLLGRGSAAGSGDAEEITLGTGLTMSGTALSSSAADNLPFFSATGTAQSINDSTWTKLQASTEIADSGGYYDPVTNYRFTPGVAGTYCIIISGGIDVDLGENHYVAIYKNGVLQESVNMNPGATTTARPTIVGFVVLNGSTDYVEAFVWHNQGAAKNTDACTFKGFRVGT